MYPPKNWSDITCFKVLLEIYTNKLIFQKVDQWKINCALNFHWKLWTAVFFKALISKVMVKPGEKKNILYIN